MIAGGVGEFGWEGTRADARAVRFHYAKNIFHAVRTDAGADASAARDRVRARDEGIGAVVEVEHGRLRAFKENAFAFADVIMHAVVRVAHVGAQTVGISSIFFKHRIEIKFFDMVEITEQAVFRCQIPT